MHAVVGDIFDKSDPSPTGDEWNNFDLATASFAFHHFEDVVHAARCLKERLRPGGVLLINDFLEGGDFKANEDGELIEGSQGTWAAHHHHHHHHHHGHGRGNGNGKKEHGHHHSEDTRVEAEASWDRERRDASIVVSSFTIDSVKKFLTEAGLIEVDVVTMRERVYMEIGGQKLWRTVLYARGRRPMDTKSEL